MRASIACISCRQSKTKCINNGAGTTCKTCESKQKACDYQDGTVNAPASGSGSSQRRESTVGDGDAPPRKRKRTAAPSSTAPSQPPENLSSDEDILDSPWLTGDVWAELFDIYEKHFATDFPFFHRRRFLRPLHQAPPVQTAGVKNESFPPPRPPHGPILLLAFLTQTARYHAGLVSQLKKEPTAIAALFAEATRKRVDDSSKDTASLERTQALLMLGFHEWTELQGQQGWIRIRLAISCAQLLGYQFDAKFDDRKESVGSDIDDEFAQQEKFIDREIQRRTFWSCFIMDQYLSSGLSRPPMLAVADMGMIQLPCSDTAFSHGQKVRTRLLGETDEKYERRRRKIIMSMDRSSERPNGSNHDHEKRDRPETEWEVGKEEGELSLYIQAVNHFGRVMKWACAGGRRCEELAPWHRECGFKQLEEDNRRLQAALPRRFVLSPRNTETHISYKTSRNYVLIHAIYTLCTVALYREYMPFLPWNVQKPQGPLDEPRITEKPPDGQPNYWSNQAQICFGVARDFAILLRSCQPAHALVETPIAGWATYIVAWCALYCHFFPRMDVDRVLDSRLQPSVWDITNTIILHMGERMKMAAQWIDFLIRLHKFFKDRREEWKAAGGSPGSTTSDSSGGGLKEYAEKFERAQKDFGSFADINWSRNAVDKKELLLQHDHEMDDRSEAPSPAMPFKREHRDVSEVTQAPTRGFTPVNKSVELHSVPVTPVAPTPTPAPPTPVRLTHEFEQQMYDAKNHARRVEIPRAHQSPYNQPIMPGYHHNAMVSGPLQHDPTLRASQTLYTIQHGVPGAVQSPNPAYWGTPAPGPDLQRINNLEQQGQPSVASFDLMSMQAAQGRVGDQSSYYNEPFFENNSGRWLGQIPFPQENPQVWNIPAPFDENYQNMDHR